MSTRLIWPDEGVSRVPYRVYADPEIYAEEQRRIFRGPVWNFLCLEVEVPASGDFRTTFVGDTPVLVTRNRAGELRAMVNRCVHKGSLVCLEPRGSRRELACVYHNWTYDLDGRLTGVAFERGVAGKGGMAPGFERASRRLTPLRVASFHGLVFGTFSESVAPFADYIGPEMHPNVERVLGRPVRVLGYHSQYMNNNWKLYMENTKDSYHASLLHLFHTTFGVVRLTWAGGVKLSADGWHHLSYTSQNSIADDSEYDSGRIRSMRKDYALEDASVMDSWWEFGDRVTNAIQTVFPTLVVQQILNTLGVRQLIPRGPDACELLWTLFGYADDTEEQTRTRLKQANLVGPAGYISMEDACVGHLIKRGAGREPDESTFMEMGGRGVAPSEGSRATETSVRGFWKAYRELMGV